MKLKGEEGERGWAEVTGPRDDCRVFRHMDSKVTVRCPCRVIPHGAGLVYDYNMECPVHGVEQGERGWIDISQPFDSCRVFQRGEELVSCLCTVIRGGLEIKIDYKPECPVHGADSVNCDACGGPILPGQKNIGHGCNLHEHECNLPKKMTREQAEKQIAEILKRLERDTSQRVYSIDIVEERRPDYSNVERYKIGKSHIKITLKSTLHEW